MTGTIVSALERDRDKTGFIVALHRDRQHPGVRCNTHDRSHCDSRASAMETSSASQAVFSSREDSATPQASIMQPIYGRRGSTRTVSLKQERDIELLQRGAGPFRHIQDWREQIRLAFLASTAGPGSAILQAMTLGEEGGLTDDMRDQLHGRRCHSHHFHLRIAPRHGSHTLLRDDQDRAAASAGAALSPPDARGRPEKDRGLAHPSAS